MVRAEKIVKRFGHLTVLNGVNLSVKRGQVVVIIGPSGSGKTTLLRCINHLEKIDSGRIYIEGEMIGYRQVISKLVEDRETPIARIRSQIGFLVQLFNLFPHMTPLENVIDTPIHVLPHPIDEVIFMDHAVIVEEGTPEQVFDNPQHERTRAFLSMIL